jgi:hypothetical protein
MQTDMIVGAKSPNNQRECFFYACWLSRCQA